MNAAYNSLPLKCIAGRMPGQTGANRPRHCYLPLVIRAACVAALLLIGDSLCAGEKKIGPETYVSAVAAARPGDVFKLASGIYKNGLTLHGLIGRPSQPIVIEAADPSQPPVFVANSGRNTISIADAGHVVVRNLVLDGRDLPVDAVKAERHSRFAHHIIIEGLRIRGHGAGQGVVGISTKCPAWGWVIRGNVIARAGTGMYLGDSDGSAPFYAGVIENNFVYDSRGYNLQIKHQRSRVEDRGMQRQETIIRHNVFSKYGNGSEGRDARPNVLVGHFPVEGAGREDRYLIYGNLFYANRDEALFQGEGSVALYSNIFVNPFGDAIHVQPHNDVPRNIWIFNNTVIASGHGIELRGDVNEYLRTYHANLVFAGEHKTSRMSGANAMLPLTAAEELLGVRLALSDRLDVKPRQAIPPSHPVIEWARPSLLDAGVDFDGVTYVGTETGAYADAPGPPRWLPRLEPKPRIPEIGDAARPQAEMAAGRE